MGGAGCGDTCKAGSWGEEEARGSDTPLSLRALKEDPQGAREELSLVRSPGKAKSLMRDERNRSWALGCEGARVSQLWGWVGISGHHHRMGDGGHVLM